MATLRILDSADKDLDELLDYLEREAGDAVAADYASSFDEQFNVLCAFPRVGSPRPRLGPNMRLWQVAPYNVFYEYDEERDVIVIFRILHGSRHIKRTMIKS